MTERGQDGGLTVRYQEEPKQGLRVQSFFGAAELGALFCGGFTPVLPRRRDRTWRSPPRQGQWSPWEAIWSRR